MIVRARLACSISLLGLVGLTTCTAPPPLASPAVLPAPGVLSREAWSFDGHAGSMIRTPSYRLYTTETDPDLLLQMPVFLEAALARYRAAVTPLPEPPLKLDTFLMGTREQWATLTRQVMGPQAPGYLLIQRGGFSSGGRALLWSIGPHDTLSIAAHEGWHQYTQRTFRGALPVWAEEGLATYMEGFLPDPAGPLRPVFSGWANVERFDQLRAAAQRGSLLSLEDLLAADPQTLIEQSTDTTLTYYAQVWALAHFLLESDNARMRRGLELMVDDAALGRLRRDRAAGPPRELWSLYWPEGLDRASLEYGAFVERVVSHGSRDHIIAGRSPLSP
jgi:hypothetical protein